MVVACQRHHYDRTVTFVGGSAQNTQAPPVVCLLAFASVLPIPCCVEARLACQWPTECNECHQTIV
eukprot:4794376-Amphidinium_carterae.1